MEARNSPAGDGGEEHRDDGKGFRIGDAVLEGGKFRDGIFPAEKQDHEDADSHEEQGEAENGIDAPDDLVHGQQRGGDVVDQNDTQNDKQQPREIPESDAFERRDVEPVGDKRRGL